MDNAGNMWKSVISNISAATPKVQDAFKQLGIEMYTTGTNGQKVMKPVYDLIIELSQAAQQATIDQSKYFEAIAGGKYQYSKLMSSISDTKTIQDDLNKSLESGGKAGQLVQDQMHTLQAELTRLGDTIQQMGHNATSGGLGDMFKNLVVDIRYLIEGMQQIPAPVVETGVAFLALLGTMKLFTTSVSTVSNVLKNLQNTQTTLRVIGQALASTITQEDVSTKSFTASLLTKINAARADVIAQQAQREAALGNVGALDAEALAARQAQAALTGMDVAAVGLTLGLSVIIPILASVAIGMGSSSEKAQQNAQDMQELTTAYQAHQSQVDSLLNTYQQLSNATDGGTVFFDSQQQKAYYDVMQQLSQILPNITDYVDAEGRSHIKNADALKQEIEQQRELAAIHAQNVIDNQDKTYNDAIAGINDLKSQFDQIQQKINNTNDALKHLSIFDPNYTDMYNGLTKALKGYSDQLDNTAQKLDGAKNKITQFHQDLANALIIQQGVQLNDQGRGMLSQLLGDVDWNKVGSDIGSVSAAVKQVSDTVVQAQKSMNDGKKANDAYGEAFSTLSVQSLLASNAQRDFTDATQQATNGANKAGQATKSLSDILSTYTTNAKVLAQAEQEMSSQHHISESTLSTLIAQYPGFVNVLGQSDTAIESYIKSLQNQNNATVATQKNQTQVVIAETRARIQAMIQEMNALNALANAEMTRIQGSDTLSASLIQAAGITASHIPDAQATLQAALGKLGDINTAQYNAVGYSGSGGSRGSKSAKSSSNPSQTYLNNISNISQRDTDALEVYKQRVDNATYVLDSMNNRLSSAETYLKAHVTDTKAASDAIAALSADTKAYNDHANALAGENWQLNQSIKGVQQQIAKVNADFKAGRIDATTHATAIRDLNNEYDKLTQTLNSNTQAIQKDKDAIAQATASITSEIVGMLQTAYQDEQKIQEDALTKIYQPQIDALTKQKDAIDQVIQSLQAQWQAQDQVNKLQDLQNQLTQVMADKRFEVVGTDGKLTYTYDTAKAADLQKQIADQQTQIQHDAQIRQLNDQKAALDTEIKNLQDTYNQKKQQLDDYWQWKLSTDQLNQDADNLIQKDGLDKALKTVQDYTNKVVAQYNQIQAAAAAAGAAIAGGLGGAGVGGGGGLPSWVRGTLSAGFGELGVGSGSLFGGMLGTLHFAKGGQVPSNAGIPGRDSVPALLSPSGIVVPSFDDLMKGAQFLNKSSSTVIQVNGNLEFPNITKPSDVELFIYDLTEKVGVHRV